MSYIDITDCLTETDEQNAFIVSNLRQSEFALVKQDARVISSDSKLSPIKYNAKILPLGIDYIETYIEEYERANKKIPPVGFKTKS